MHGRPSTTQGMALLEESLNVQHRGEMGGYARKKSREERQNISFVSFLVSGFFLSSLTPPL